MRAKATQAAREAASRSAARPVAPPENDAPVPFDVPLPATPPPMSGDDEARPLRRKRQPGERAVRTYDPEGHKRRMARYNARVKQRKLEQAARQMRDEEAEAVLDRLPSDLPEPGDDDDTRH